MSNSTYRKNSGPVPRGFYLTTYRHEYQVQEGHPLLAYQRNHQPQFNTLRTQVIPPKGRTALVVKALDDLQGGEGTRQDLLPALSTSSSGSNSLLSRQNNSTTTTGKGTQVDETTSHQRKISRAFIGQGGSSFPNPPSRQLKCRPWYSEYADKFGVPAGPFQPRVARGSTLHPDHYRPGVRYTVPQGKTLQSEYQACYTAQVGTVSLAPNSLTSVYGPQFKMFNEHKVHDKRGIFDDLIWIRMFVFERPDRETPEMAQPSAGVVVFQKPKDIAVGRHGGPAEHQRPHRVPSGRESNFVDRLDPVLVQSPFSVALKLNRQHSRVSHGATLTQVAGSAPSVHGIQLVLQPRPPYHPQPPAFPPHPNVP
ncbi:unnamed protein product [Lota lota]